MIMISKNSSDSRAMIAIMPPKSRMHPMGCKVTTFMMKNVDFLSH